MQDKTVKCPYNTKAHRKWQKWWAQIVVEPGPTKSRELGKRSWAWKVPFHSVDYAGVLRPLSSHHGQLGGSPPWWDSRKSSSQHFFSWSYWTCLPVFRSGFCQFTYFPILSNRLVVPGECNPLPRSSRRTRRLRPNYHFGPIPHWA